MTYFKKGTWNVVCDICGVEYKSDQVRKNWQGLIVCPQDWEPRQPQDSLRVRPEKQGVPFSRPEPEDTFIDLCYVWERSAYANLAVAGCMIAGNTSLTATHLIELKGT